MVNNKKLINFVKLKGTKKTAFMNKNKNGQWDFLTNLRKK